MKTHGYIDKLDGHAQVKEHDWKPLIGLKVFRIGFPISKRLNWQTFHKLGLVWIKIILESWAWILTVHFAMKVLHRRSQWESIFAKKWSQHSPTMIAKGSYKFLTGRKDDGFSPFAEHLTIASAWCLSKCYSVLTCCSNTDSVKLEEINLHQFTSWFAASLTESKVSELCGCIDIYSHELICVRKTKFLCSENKIPLSHMKCHLHVENEIS